MKDKYKNFAKAAAIRAVRTFFQVFVSGIPTTAVAVGSVNWGLIASVALTSAIVSLGTSIATGLPEVEE